MLSKVPHLRWLYDPTIVPRRRMFIGKWQLFAYEDGGWAVDHIPSLKLVAKGRAAHLRGAKWRALRAFVGHWIGRTIAGTGTD